MWLRWLPWKYLIRRTAKSYQILDPVNFLARLRRFAQPSEVQEPMELLRAGIVFHARGLINTRAIQYNLDWVWPFWVEKQFNPDDASFVPRGFSFSHVNLTHRNWTAIGHPDVPVYPIIDPRGLLTPFFDGWSLDFWIVTDTGDHMFLSRVPEVHQQLLMTDNQTVHTTSSRDNLNLETAASLEFRERRPEVSVNVKGSAGKGGWIAASLRPYNPEGIQFIEKIAYIADRSCFIVNGNTRVVMSENPSRTVLSDYRKGDAALFLNRSGNDTTVECSIGMATGTALFRIPDNGSKTVKLRIPMADKPEKGLKKIPVPARSFRECLDEKTCLEIPDERITFLFNAALRTLALLSAGDVVPGPYTYRRFWFRDACFMINALISAGFLDRAFQKLSTFPSRQKGTGYFQSQEGEWDSNGQVLWIISQYQKTTGSRLDRQLAEAVFKGARWIVKKRTSRGMGARHAGLLPAGFSAEHLGPNDYYYWDNFWGLAGLKAAASLAESMSFDSKAAELEEAASDFETCIFKTIREIPGRSSEGGIPASCYRRLDAGAVGSLVADYPLRLTPPGDPSVMNTAAFLMEDCFHNGAFFQDMIHSGINAYLTLAIAQTLLRAGDNRYIDLINTTADLASPTGNWPEAIHPHTGGGCMGDGHHGWAAAEWFMMIRNLFVREEGDGVIIGSGIFPEWLEQGTPVRFGPVWTEKGRISLTAEKKAAGLDLSVSAVPASREFKMTVDIPGYRKQTVESTERDISLSLEPA